MSTDSNAPIAADGVNTQQTQAEYMDLYRELQSSAAAAAAADSVHAATGIDMIAASMMHNNEADSQDGDDADADSDADSDVDGCNSRFIFPGLTYPPSEAQRFRLSHWVPSLRSHTIPTRFVKLSTDFITYLLEDGVYIPDEYAPVNSSNFHGRDSEGFEEELEQEWKTKIEEMATSEEEEEDDESVAHRHRHLTRSQQPFFPELMSQFQNILDEFQHAVFPSLDFKAPTDANWIMTERLTKCQTIGDILLLLKSSDKIQAELENPFAQCQEEEEESTVKGIANVNIDDTPSSQPGTTQTAPFSSSSSSIQPASSTSAAATGASSSLPFEPVLALRKWSTLHPSQLFRCFIWHGTLLSMCQMDPNFYEHLQSSARQEDLQDSIEAWLEDDLLPRLQQLNGEEFDTFVMDVYVDTKERCWLVKLKPFWPKATRAILFSWKEIYEFTLRYEEEEEKRKRLKVQTEAMLASGALSLLSPAGAAPSAPSPASSALWPTTASLNVPFRVVPSASAGMDILRTMDTMSTRFPVDGFDVSDSAAIERWINRVEAGDLKQN